MTKLSHVFLPVFTLALAAGCARNNGLSKSEVRPEPGRSETAVLAHPALTQVNASGVSIADVAERVLPSVVTISTTVSQRQPTRFSKTQE